MGGGGSGRWSKRKTCGGVLFGGSTVVAGGRGVLRCVGGAKTAPLCESPEKATRQVPPRRASHSSDPC